MYTDLHPFILGAIVLEYPYGDFHSTMQHCDDLSVVRYLHRVAKK